MTIAKKLSHFALTGAMVVGGAAASLTIGADTANAASPSSYTAAAEPDSAGVLTQTSASTLLITPAHGMTIDPDAQTISQNGKTETLPTKSADRFGNPVELEYVQTGDGVEIRAISPQASMDKSAGKCLAGIGGGAVTGATATGLAGAAVGTVTLPVVGTVGGGTVGAIGGAVGGGLTGAAASCFG